jgi:hypothetical protein
VLGLLIPAGAAIAQTAPGATPADFSVDASGNVAAHIEITVPPGPHGCSPSSRWRTREEGCARSGHDLQRERRAGAAGVVFRVGEATTVVLFLSANPDPASPLEVEKEQNCIVRVRNGAKLQTKIRIEGLPDLDLLEFPKALDCTLLPLSTFQDTMVWTDHSQCAMRSPMGREAECYSGCPALVTFCTFPR